MRKNNSNPSFPRKRESSLLDRQRKQFGLKCTAESLAIAQRLYDTDKPRYQFLFGWINGTAKRHKSPALVLQTIKRLAEKEATDNKALDVPQYVGGTLRKLEQERDAKKIRNGSGIEAVKPLETLAELLRRSGYKVERSDVGDQRSDRK